MNPVKRKKKSRKKPVLNLDQLSFREFLKNSPDGLVVFDTDNVIHAFNKGAEEIFGYSAREAMGKPFHFLVPPDLLEKGEVERLQELVDKNGRLERCCVTRLHKNGNRIKLELTRSPMRNRDDQLIGYEAVFRDITRNVEFEKEIRLTEKLNAVSTLVSGLAHELGTPLNIIQGHAELVLSEIDPKESAAVSLKTIISACRRMTAIMKSLLQFVSQKEAEPIPLDIRNILEEILNFLRIQLKKQDIDTVIQVEKHLPMIKGDKTQIEEIFLNVIMNSIQATSRGGRLEIKAGIQNEDGWDYVATIIKDNGMGIPTETLPYVFEPFFTTKEVGKGTGLGLYITHNLVQRSKGKIKIESNPGSGTTVSILLPVGPVLNKEEEE